MADKANRDPTYAPPLSELSTPASPLDAVASNINSSSTTTGGISSYATTLPATPTTGVVAVLVDSTTSPTYQWTFRYNGTSSFADKWEFIGGAPAKSYTQAAVSSAAGSNVWSAALGASLTLPNAGVYDVRWSGHDDGNGAGSSTDFGIGYGAVPASSDEYLTGTNASQGFYRHFRKTGITAGMVLDFYIRDSDSGRRNPWSWRTLEVTPVRVS